MMRDSILGLPKQFEFDPVVSNASKLKKRKKFLVCGMGGSHLAGDFISLLADSPQNLPLPLLRKEGTKKKKFSPYEAGRMSGGTFVKEGFDMVVHSDYGLPNIPDLEERLIIVSSYSGNTEEEIDNLNEARKRKLPVAVIVSGGRLLSLANKYRIPFIELPSGVQPRMAIGYSLLGILKLMKRDSLLERIKAEGVKLQPAKIESAGKVVARKLSGRIPVIYSSVQNKALAYYWKITLNETGKVPAFYNVFPELNHNEMQGFGTKKLSDKFSFIFLEDKNDHPKIQKRMKVMKGLFAKKHLPVEAIHQVGASQFQRVFNSMFLAAWTAYFLAIQNHLNPEQVPLIEEFKRGISYDK